jgi:hypothetical protein
MIFSSLADSEFNQAINKAGVEYANLGPPTGFEVRFEVEEVFGDGDWLNFLVNERGLVHKKGQFLHTLRCVAIHKSKEQEFADDTALLERMKQLNQTFAAITDAN